MKLNRSFVTPVLIIIFLVVAFSGILMFFHLLDDYTTAVHEIMGLTFVLFSILHLIINWRSTKSYFPKKIFTISAAVVLLLSIFLVVVDTYHKGHDDVLIEKLVTAPIAETCVVLGIEITQLGSMIGADDMIAGEQETIESLARRYNRSPGKLLALIVENQH